MHQDRKLIVFLLLGLFITSPLWSDISAKGFHIEPSLSEDWTKIGFILANNGEETAKLTIKTVIGPVESASAFSSELTIPSKCSWELSCPVFSPSVGNESSRSLRRRFEATVYVHQGGALLHRENILAPLIRSKPPRFLHEGFSKPKDRWSVDGLWNRENWSDHHGSVQFDIDSRKLRARSSTLSYPSFKEHFKNRILVLESLKNLDALDCSQLLLWIESGGLLILSENRTQRHPLHEALSFFPAQKSWSAPGQKEKPFQSMLHHFLPPWKSWEYKGKVLGSWREFSHGRILVTQVPTRELIGAKIIQWKDIVEQFRAPSLLNLWTEAEGKAWMKHELLQNIDSEVWSRNLVGLYLASLFILVIALAQLPVIKKNKELRWVLWCGLSLFWCAGGFIYHLLTTDPSTRMNSVEVVVKKVGTQKAQSLGLSTWRSGSKRRLDLDLKGYNWSLKESQESHFNPHHWGPQGWEVRPGKSKFLGWKRSQLSLPFEDPQLIIEQQPMLSVPESLLGLEAVFVLGDQVWKISALNALQDLKPSSATSVKDHQGPLAPLLTKWLGAERMNQKTYLPPAWLLLKNPNVVLGFPFPDKIISQEQQWLWYAFPTTEEDRQKLSSFHQIPVPTSEIQPSFASSMP